MRVSLFTIKNNYSDSNVPGLSGIQPLIIVNIITFSAGTFIRMDVLLPRSPLREKSYLFSFPLLNNMLKFRRSSSAAELIRSVHVVLVEGAKLLLSSFCSRYPKVLDVFSAS